MFSYEAVNGADRLCTPTVAVEEVAVEKNTELSKKLESALSGKTVGPNLQSMEDYNSVASSSSRRYFFARSTGSRVLRTPATSSRLRYVMPGSDIECPW